jgi:hypothetical protein
MERMMIKVAIVVLSEMEEHQDLGRVVNALQVAKEFRQSGDDVEVIFDGGGVVSAVQLADPEHRLHRAYELVEDKVAGLCRYCARAFDVYERAEELELPFIAEFEQHPSLRSRVADGFEIITF